MSNEEQKWKDQVHQSLMDALESVGIKIGDKVNLLVSTEIPRNYDESTIYTLFRDKSLFDITTTSKGRFFKKKVMTARSKDFILTNDEMKSWHDWADDIYKSHNINVSPGVCRASN